MPCKINYTELTILGTDTNSPTASPVIRPADARQHDSPKSSPSGTPVHEKGGDYFTRPPRLTNPSTRSLPSTPNGSRGNISFSPRIQFYDAWSASDYDRRGEIATCNRLTPMLAQQIKEELNSFKMVRPILHSPNHSLTEPGNGSSRALQAPHSFLLTTMHTSFGPGVLANHFPP